MAFAVPIFKGGFGKPYYRGRRAEFVLFQPLINLKKIMGFQDIGHRYIWLRNA
jgi:hypothetical protein